MLADHSHQGATAPGPFARPRDRALLELDDAMRVNEVAARTRPLYGFMRDAHRAAQPVRDDLTANNDIYRGIVIHAIPHMHWYKVQLGQGQGWIAACFPGTTGLVPIGPRDTSPIPPNSSVLVYKPRGLNHGYILGVIPPALATSKLACPDWLVQGSGAGIKRENAHKFPIKNLYQHGGVVDWSAGRPLDSTAFEKGWITPTGLALSLDDFMIQIRVNEQCGLWMSIFDSWCRLAGMQLDIESAVHGEYARDDEGEARHFRGIATYPWEALGLYASGTAFTSEYTDRDVHYENHKAKIDLPEGAADLQPIYRYQEYGGYLGQGHLRAVVVPAAASGIQHYSDQLPDRAVFRESIGLDGAYALVSAKRVLIGKRSKIVMPKEIATPEDAGGDDAAAGNYKFSGQFGGGAAHVISDVNVNGAHSAMRRCAAVNDIIAYAVNWQPLHPFHYHQHDFQTFQESALAGKIQDALDFSALADAPSMADPAPTPMRVDHRYGEVDYFQRESCIVLHDDGSVQIGCGFGADILLTGGHIKLRAPGQIACEAGTDLVVLASQAMIRAKQSVDISATEHDVRIKAERNMQLLAGNGGTGGILLESKSVSNIQNYADKAGEDVISNGIVLLAHGGVVSTLAGEIYLRTTGAATGSGNITLDANRGFADVSIYGRAVHTFSTDRVTFSFGPSGENSAVCETYVFDAAHCLIDVNLDLGGQLRGYRDGGIVVLGDVVSAGCVVASDMGTLEGGPLGIIPSGYLTAAAAALAAVAITVPAVMSTESQYHSEFIVQWWYMSGQIGNTDLMEVLGFSFRDSVFTVAGEQYHTTLFEWPEPRWQMLVRLGGGSGGAVWTERKVLYQGEDTFPWPGGAPLLGESLLQLDDCTMYDVGAGQDVDRPYAAPTVADVTAVPMNETYCLIR